MHTIRASLICKSRISSRLMYGRALGTGQGLLNPDTQEERLKSIPGAAGYGIAFGCIDGWVGHTSELPGYNTTVYYHATSDITVAVQTNSDIWFPGGSIAVFALRKGVDAKS